MHTRWTSWQPHRTCLMTTTSQLTFVGVWKSFYRGNRIGSFFIIWTSSIGPVNTNHFDYATIRILEDVILGRQVAFNTVAFVDFCVSVWESYIVERLLNVAHNRCYLVSSVKNADALSSVSVWLGVCECINGEQGAFCKHQALVQNKCWEISLTCQRWHWQIATHWES